MVLLATCLNAIKIPDAFHDFLTPYLSNFLASPTYQNMCKSLSWVFKFFSASLYCYNSSQNNIILVNANTDNYFFFIRNTSGIFSSYRFRQQDHKPLPHLHSIVYNARNSPVFIVSDRPTVYFVSSLVRFYNNTKCPDKGAWLNDGIHKYIDNFARNTEFKLSLNWFLRHEILFVLDLLKSPIAQASFDKSQQLRVAYKILNCLTETQINDVLHIFSQLIFNIDMYPHNMGLTKETLIKLKSTYGKVCAETYLNNADTQVKLDCHC